MKILSKVILAVSLLVGVSSQADILIEPYLGYHLGKWKAGSTSEDLSGMVFGGRLGFSTLGFQAGLDYMGGELKDDATPKSEFTVSNLGVFVGYNFPILVRVYGSYFFDAELKDTFKLEGTAIRLGVGFSPLPLLDVNLEYMMGTYDKVNGSSINPDVKTDTYGLVLSIPFEL